MKRLDENKVDKVFKDGLTGSENDIPFHEEDWKAMEKLLDKKSGKKVIAFRWVYYASGIAAMLLVAFGVFLMIRKENAVTRPPRVVKQPPVKLNRNKTQTSNDPSGQQLLNPVSALSANQQTRESKRTLSRNSHPFLSLSAARKGRYPASRQTSANQQNILPVITSDTSTIQPNILASTDNNKPVVSSDGDTTAIQTSTQPIEQPKAEKKRIKPITGGRPQFTLSILAAPDVNGVGSLGRSQVGTNFGVLASLQLSKKLSISTGAAYAIKPYEAYNTDYTSAFKPRVAPTNIAANCKVLDIPVNVSYQVYSKGRDAFAVGTGLSSYLMLREHYRFDYEYNPEVAPFNLDISNQNRHWFGVLNLNVTYQRQLNSRFNLLVQPYYKIPLTGIGNGRVNLQSAGIALGASWNINPFGKPK